VCLAALAAAVSPGRAAHAAADDEDAEALISRGIELRERGNDDEALSVFRIALAKAPSPRARAQVALAEQALGLWVPAESDLVAALAAADDAWIVRNQGALAGALAVVRRHVGSLEVRGTQGAEVLLDGVRLGALPAAAPFRVEAGKRTLELRAKGFHATTRAIEIPAGAVARETVSLVALPAEPAEPRAGSPVAGADADPGRGQRLIGWSFAGVGGALLLTGAAGMLVRSGIVSDYNDRCPGLGVGQPADCDDKISAANTWLTVSMVSLVGGGVFALGGLTLVLTTPRRARPSAGIGCGPVSARGGAYLGCAGSF
jgi:hypothetical protein